ncbi:hypothetical protein XENTR_v10005051 [Xenopus tropicalis]|nr:hypothetical protein XENTR_v10005051 [Xenopus tropicalis]
MCFVDYNLDVDTEEREGRRKIIVMASFRYPRGEGKGEREKCTMVRTCPPTDSLSHGFLKHSAEKGQVGPGRGAVQWQRHKMTAEQSIQCHYKN